MKVTEYEAEIRADSNPEFYVYDPIQPIGFQSRHVVYVVVNESLYFPSGIATVCMQLV